MKTVRKLLAMAALGVAMSAGSAQAAQIGDNISCAVTGGGSFSCDQASAVVGAGPEFGIGSTSTYFSADFSNGLLTFTALRDGSYGATIVNFQNLTSDWTSALLGPTTWAGLTADDVVLSNGLLSIDLRNSGVTIPTGTSFQISFGSAVPEPGAWAMMIVGFGAVGSLVRSRRRLAQAAA